MRRVSFSTSDSFFTNSYRIRREQRDFSYKQFVNKCQFFSLACDNLYQTYVYLYFILGLFCSSSVACICARVVEYRLDFNGPIFAGSFARSTLTTRRAFGVGVPTRAACRPRTLLSATCVFAAANLQCQSQSRFSFKSKHRKKCILLFWSG